MKTLIVIPARAGSTRFPRKPLHLIAGRSLLARVVAIAAAACRNDTERSFVVATDDAEIAAHAEALDAPAVLTDPALPSGTDRALAAARAIASDADFIVNLQGDAPFTPPAYVDAIIRAGAESPHELVTPVIQLSWPALDELRARKAGTPFSGTTAIVDASGEALWFSKAILPAIRKEDALRQTAEMSPVWRHIGLYGYRRTALERFVSLPEGQYERLEGLEQLRFLENGMRVRAVTVTATPNAMWGVDTPEDATHAEALIAAHGEPVYD